MMLHLESRNISLHQRERQGTALVTMAASIGAGSVAMPDPTRTVTQPAFRNDTPSHSQTFRPGTCQCSNHGFNEIPEHNLRLPWFGQNNCFAKTKKVDENQSLWAKTTHKTWDVLRPSSCLKACCSWHSTEVTSPVKMTWRNSNPTRKSVQVFHALNPWLVQTSKRWLTQGAVQTLASKTWFLIRCILRIEEPTTLLTDWSANGSTNELAHLLSSICYCAFGPTLAASKRLMCKFNSDIQKAGKAAAHFLKVGKWLRHFPQPRFQAVGLAYTQAWNSNVCLYECWRHDLGHLSYTSRTPVRCWDGHLSRTRV